MESHANLSFDGSVLWDGEVRLLGAKIGGQLICSDAKFTNPRAKDDTNAYAFSAEGTDVGRDLLLRGAKATGEVRLLGAKIGGQFICSVAVFTNPRAKDDTNAYAFNADGTEVGEICIFDSVKTTGMVRLLGAKIGRSLSCHNATFKNPGAPQYGKAHAFIGDGLEVDGDMLFTDAEASGMVRLLGAKIGGQLNCDGATFGNPRAGKGNEVLFPVRYGHRRNPNCWGDLQIQFVHRGRRIQPRGRVRNRSRGSQNRRHFVSDGNQNGLRFHQSHPHALWRPR